MILSEVQFHPVIADWFQRRYGAASPPQAQGWPAIAAGRHTLILAPTGSGKTLAAFLWCIDRLFRISLDQKETDFIKNRTGVHTLYISPLKALNNDIHYNLQEPLLGIKKAAEESGLLAAPIRAALRTGDTTASDRQKLLRKPPHILITTPESLYLLLTSIKGRELFRRLRYIIVDEIHSLCNNKRGVHLSLSLERLNRLVQDEPLRIGLSATQRPLETVAAFLGGQKWDSTGNTMEPRPVSIVDCGRRKEMNLSVISAVPSFGDLPEATVWPAVVQKLYDLIVSHRTTLVFVNMRAQTEKLARQLNELHQQKTGEPSLELALAHHGSISREMRYDIEAKLKQGAIPAVIATSSLELGIDIGSIDLVVQVESPKTVSSALQRVGRSGHLLSATSKGCMIPLYPADLDDCLAITEAMLKGAIEETVVPENCLDVLAQQVVAEVASETWDRRALYHLFRQSHCYRNLPESAFNQTVEMLAGKFSDEPLMGLQPRLSWDQINDRLISRRGSRHLAVMNMGTIPDRGYYTVVLADAGQKLGEVEEEFVFESRVGDHFFLGNSEWRIHQIDRNAIKVTPVHAVKPRAPFWKGESLFKSYATSARIGAFRAEVLRQADGVAWLVQTCHSDQASAENLLHYLLKQKELTHVLPTDTSIVVEQFVDVSSIPHMVLHAPFGSRVMGAWAMALSALLEKEYGLEFQYTFDDDGLLFRFPDTLKPPSLDRYFSLSIPEMERLLLQGLSNSPIFSIRFRHNAARALILPRSRPGKRIPLWLQRLRSADLLQAVRRHPDFPILVETFRDCLQDVFDWPTLQELLLKISAGEIQLSFVRTLFPSPMASGLMFRFLSGHLYEYDRSRVPDQAAAVSNDLLAEILRRDQLPAILTNDLVEEAEKKWQHLTHDTRARDAEELWQIIDQQGPLSCPQLNDRSIENPGAWLELLQKSGRIVFISEIGWSIPATPQLLSEMEIVKRFLAWRGPKTLAEIQRATGIEADTLQEALAEMVAGQQLLTGVMQSDVHEICWCRLDRFAELYRRAIARRRLYQQPADAVIFANALFQNRFQNPQAKWTGYYLPIRSLERDLFTDGLDDGPWSDLLQTIRQGEITVIAGRNSETGRRLITFWPAGRGHIFTNRQELLTKTTGLSGAEHKVWQFLQENGASFTPILAQATGLSMLQLFATLQELAIKGLVSCDDYDSLLSILEGEFQIEETKETGSLSHWQPFPRRSKPGRSVVRRRVQQQQGRWFLTSSYAVMGPEMDLTQQAEQQARLLLQRYGVVVKEVYRREQGLLAWPLIFHSLKRLEWQGEIRRGYFVQGLSGIQFALPEFLTRLEKQEPLEASLIMLATLDALWSLLAVIDKNLLQRNGKSIDIVRLSGNHVCFYLGRPVVYVENYGQRLHTTDHFVQYLAQALAEKIKTWLRLPDIVRPRKRIEIFMIDDVPAAVHPIVDTFLHCGFEKEGETLVLWPSGV